MDTEVKQALKAQAHHLRPVILIGSKGLTDAIVAETEVAINAHELIKIKINGAEKAERLAMINDLCTKTQATLVQFIGNTGVLYRLRKD